jgi:nucleotide-binding universal stress UspA family protein
MNNGQVISRIDVRNILFLTDFSEPSDVALPYATSLARGYRAQVLALHVLLPKPSDHATVEQGAAYLDSMEQRAAASMARVDSQLAGVKHETITLYDSSLWSAVRKFIDDGKADLIVTGTHGRTGVRGFLDGSVAEEIFRRADVPVLVVGPLAPGESHEAGRFHRVLFATDFSPESEHAGPFAVSIAEENESKLLLLHVLRERRPTSPRPDVSDSVANVMHLLNAIVPSDAQFWCRPEAAVRFGDPAAAILEAASEFRADLIVLGVRNSCGGACGHACGEKHPERTTARAVIANAKCPVLAVKGAGMRSASLRYIG